MKPIVNCYDPRLPDWGPYSKNYAGISHIADQEKGLRFDLTAAPGIYRRKICLPNAMYECGYHPTASAPDYSYYSHRHVILENNLIYADISFSKISESARLIRCEFVNCTDLLQSLTLHLMASLHPYNRSNKLYGYDLLRPAEVKLPDGALWVDAQDYTYIHIGEERMNQGLVSGGGKRGEALEHGFVRGSGVFIGYQADDALTYRFTLPAAMKETTLLIRCRLGIDSRSCLQLCIRNECGLQHHQTIEVNGGEEFLLVPLLWGELPEGVYDLHIVAKEGGRLLLDGFAVVELQAADQVYFKETEWNLVPDQLPGPDEHSVLLKYEHTEQIYGIKWLGGKAHLREILNEPLDEFIRIHSRRNSTSTFVGNRLGHYTEIYIHPVQVEPQGSRTVYALVCSGTQEEVLQQLNAFPGDREACERIYLSQRDTAVCLPHNSAGSEYVQSQQLMVATIMQNVVYPVYVRGNYIRHFTPGHFWDSLYTWDSGFIGIGMSSFSLERSIDVLNTYVTDPGDRHSAFLHHGTILPVQHYQFQEIWNRTLSRELLAFFYPRLRQYYHYYAGHSIGSTMRLPSGLLRPFDYFYNSGGWDDYPAQEHTHEARLADRTAPVVSTSHAIRIAKLLRMCAIELGGLDEDIDLYTGDITEWTALLHQQSWDEESGYFGYVHHNENGQPTGILRHSSGQNFNMGLDGIQPLVAGVVTEEQERRIIGHLTSSERLWSSVGISTVDQSAAYYNPNGYWNGCVWMPHQWFIWKSLLNTGYSELAEQVARTALNTWKSNVELTNNTAEHFIIETGTGAGWHHFSGLSSPVVHWFTSLYTPGTITGGFDIWNKAIQFAEGYRSAAITLQKHNANRSRLLVVLNEDLDYEACTDEGVSLELRSLHPGTIDIALPAGVWQGTILIRSTGR
ncbi:trehalase family glycosidase [Paenibacillus shunpengii]|uniref:Trehalase family glycosidase n=1 Tax=Paenibacillus shunpengii TaxID=2054424 RepID=A0ABW5SQ81_9BACL